MGFLSYIKELGRGHEGAKDLSFEDAYRMYSAMLDGGVPELELGAILMAMRIKTESMAEILGFYQAVDERLYRLKAPLEGVRPVVIPSYNGARRQANLLPLLALLLQRFGIPVLLHGTLEANGRVATAYILRELGIMPCGTLAQAQQAVNDEHLAFVPTAVLSPGLGAQLSMRNRMGVRNSAHTLVKLIDPFEGGGLRIVSVTHSAYLDKLREFFGATEATALLMRGTEGESFANPKRRPQLEFFDQGTSSILFEAELGPLKTLPAMPQGTDARATASWIRQALAGDAALPMPLVNQLACCLYASGYTHDMNQAKAIVAVETGSLAVA